MLSFWSWKIKTTELMNPCIARAKKPWTRSKQITANLEFLRNIRVIPILVGMVCLALNKHLPSLLFVFFSFCFSCVSLTSAVVIEKRSLCCFYFIKSSVASCSQCCFCKAEERVAADEKDSPLLLPVQRGWKALKADKANLLLLLLAHGTEKMTLLEGWASTTCVKRSWVTVLLLHDLLLLLEGSCWTTTSHGGTGQWLPMKNVFQCCSGSCSRCWCREVRRWWWFFQLLRGCVAHVRVWKSGSCEGEKASCLSWKTRGRSRFFMFL